MPLYEFQTEAGDVVVTFYTIEDAPRIGDAVVLEDGRSAVRILSPTVGVNPPSCWPMESVAMGVHPDQRKELIDYCREHDCPTDVSEDGNPILTSKEHRRKHAELRGFFDRDAGHGDPLPKNL